MNHLVQAYTYGFCGPLALSASEAVVIDSSYNGGFMLGRLVSVALAGFIRPRNMIIMSCLACVSASSLLVAMADVNKYWLYAGSGIGKNRYGGKRSSIIIKNAFFFAFYIFLSQGCLDFLCHGNLAPAILGLPRRLTSLGRSLHWSL